ncbi:hypothetical protein KPL71_009112 [Citrus sinensis]|uniref:Uncharacterized protein n=1 Tax=Citrus sinensis TaxID=2711 RepID=A0ACB8MB84_CITSI|nr:hypothetical protein KPL71_009112 [Citrus sinensis]
MYCLMNLTWEDCRVATTLALLGQTSLEDKIVGAIGLENSDDSVLDFWNITRIGESCSGGGCKVCAETKVPALASSTATSVGASQSPLLCSQCERKVCKVCCAGRGALLFSNYKSRDVTNYNGFSTCEEVPVQTTQSYNALNEVVGSCLKDSVSERIQSSDNVQAAEVLHQLCGGQESLAEFPFASCLH